MPWDTSGSAAFSRDEAKPEGDGAAPGGGGNLLQGVAKVLWEASAALARLGVGSGGTGPASGGGSAANAGLVSPAPVDPLGLFPAERGARGQAPTGAAGSQLANAASALAQAAAALKLGQGGADDEAGGASAGGAGSQQEAEEVEEEEPNTTPAEFVETHGLESWVGEALEMLTPSQCAAVVNPTLNVERARNPNGVVLSRIKQVAPIDQRVQMFVRVNDLAEGVVDRLSTLTPEQLEATMETGLKIQKAQNPSGVAMKRITEVLKRTQPRDRNVALVPRHDGPVGGYRGQRYNSPGDRRRGRSYSRGRGRAEASSRSYGGGGGGGGGVGSGMPADVQQAMEDLSLDPWCGEVLRRLSLWQRQTVIREIGTMRSVRNPSGVVMSRVRAIAKTDELLAIFIDINCLDRTVEAKLWELTQEQRAAVMAPGIYVQNVRNSSTAVRSRITNVVDGRGAMERGPPWRKDGRDKGSGNEDGGREARRGRSNDRFGRRNDRRRGRGYKRSRPRSSSSDDDNNEDDDGSSPPARRRRLR